MALSPFFEVLSSTIHELGGFRNGHLHLDRAETLSDTIELIEADKDEGLSHHSLQKKHSLISRVHATRSYASANLEAKLERYLRKMVATGTSVADSLIDVADDGLGLRALEAAETVRNRLQGEIEFNIGAYNPLGFRDDRPRRWKLFEEAAERSQFIGLLPERDDHARYPEHIGFDEVCRRSMVLAKSLSKPLHVHVDQTNLQSEGASERVLDIYETVGPWDTGVAGEPNLWMIHVISPSAYEEARFQRLVGRFSDDGVGLISCPSAAISMRQVRNVQSPTHNSIARVLDFLSAGVPVRIGSDNICDILSPAGIPDLTYEVFVLAHALRFFEIPVLAKIASGNILSREERDNVADHLARDLEEVKRIAEWERTKSANRL